MTFDEMHEKIGVFCGKSSIAYYNFQDFRHLDSIVQNAVYKAMLESEVSKMSAKIDTMSRTLADIKAEIERLEK